MFELRYERGLFVYSVPNEQAEGGFMVCYSMQAVPRKEDGSLTDLIVSEGGPVTLESRQAIHYCPWCGVWLSRFYRGRLDQFYDEKIAAALGPSA